jgi:hypothetical protein
MRRRDLVIPTAIVIAILSIRHASFAADVIDLVDPLFGAKCEGGNLGGGKTFPPV